MSDPYEALLPKVAAPSSAAGAPEGGGSSAPDAAAIRAAVIGGGQGMTMGAGQYPSAVIAWAVDNVKGLYKKYPGISFDDALKLTHREIAATREANPKAYMAGDIAGSVVGAGKISKMLPGTGTLENLVRTGAIQGGVQGATANESTGDWKDTAKDTLNGVGLSALFSGAVGTAGKAVRGAKDWFAGKSAQAQADVMNYAAKFDTSYEEAADKIKEMAPAALKRLRDVFSGKTPSEPPMQDGYPISYVQPKDVAGVAAYPGPALPTAPTAGGALRNVFSAIPSTVESVLLGGAGAAAGGEAAKRMGYDENTGRVIGAVLGGAHGAQNAGKAVLGHAASEGSSVLQQKLLQNPRIVNGTIDFGTKTAAGAAAPLIPDVADKLTQKPDQNSTPASDDPYEALLKAPVVSQPPAQTVAQPAEDDPYEALLKAPAPVQTNQRFVPKDVQAARDKDASSIYRTEWANVQARIDNAQTDEQRERALGDQRALAREMKLRGFQTQ